ncbi:hypothetical protein LCGC14_2975700, partial [marine sediment metagenome]
SRGVHLDQRLSSSDVTLGPAVGLYQMEKPTFNSVYADFLDNPVRKLFCMRTNEWAFPAISRFEQMAGNVYYATAIARMNYYRHPENLPHADDIDGLWNYYKKYWNSYLGATTRTQWDEAYNTLVAPLYTNSIDNI